MLKIAMLGADSSHTEAYAELMNPPGSPFHGRGRVVSLWGADVDQAYAKATACQIDSIVSSPQAALAGVDLVMVVARYGEDHFPLAEVGLQAGLPTFIDKPLTNSLTQAHALKALSEEHNAPIFSCSPLRYAAEVLDLQKQLEADNGWITGGVMGLAAYPSLGERADNIYFYGVHLVEMLFAVFGRGAEVVSFTKGALSDTATLCYPDKRLVTLDFLRAGSETYAISTATPTQARFVNIDAWGSFYQQTLEQILTFGASRRAAVSLDETIETIHLLDQLETIAKARIL